MKKLLGHLCAWLLVGSACLYAVNSQAIVIEGTTPQGTFKAVGLDSSAAFRVAVSTGISYHVITDTGSHTTVDNIVEIKGGAANTPVPVSGAGGGAIAVTGSFTATTSTAGIVVAAHFNIATGGVSVLAIDATRKQSIICNNDPSGLTAWLGPSGVSTANGIPLAAGACMSPDVPSSFVGELVAVGTAAATGSISVIYFK